MLTPTMNNRPRRGRSHKGGQCALATAGVKSWASNELGFGTWISRKSTDPVEQNAPAFSLELLAYFPKCAEWVRRIPVRTAPIN